jgi:quercetin dioxygenase-like cupin family protein
MSEVSPPIPAPSPRFLPAGADWFGEGRGLTMSQIAFKCVPTPGRDVLLLENHFDAPGGPPRHLHYAQDEWFYALEGDFAFEVGAERFTLHPGDALLAPRQVAHVWAYTGRGAGRILIAFTPAGQMEAFFRQTMRAHQGTPRDPAIWRAHGMELLGPPLALG